MCKSKQVNVVLSEYLYTCVFFHALKYPFSLAAMEVLNYVGRADGKRGAWRTDKTEAR